VRRGASSRSVASSCWGESRANNRVRCRRECRTGEAEESGIIKWGGRSRVDVSSSSSCFACYVIMGVRGGRQKNNGASRNSSGVLSKGGREQAISRARVGSGDGTLPHRLLLSLTHTHNSGNSQREPANPGPSASKADPWDGGQAKGRWSLGAGQCANGVADSSALGQKMQV
jgi:hypothetical protein